MEFMDFLNPAILGSTVAVIALVVDYLEKKMDKNGIFADLKGLALGLGKGLGQMLAGAIPGNKIEPEIAELLDHFEKITETFYKGLDAGLGEGENKDN